MVRGGIGRWQPDVWPECADGPADQLAHGQSHPTYGTLCHPTWFNGEGTWEVARDAERLQNSKIITSPQNWVSTARQFFSLPFQNPAKRSMNMLLRHKINFID